MVRLVLLLELHDIEHIHFHIVKLYVMIGPVFFAVLCHKSLCLVHDTQQN